MSTLIQASKLLQKLVTSRRFHLTREEKEIHQKSRFGEIIATYSRLLQDTSIVDAVQESEASCTYLRFLNAPPSLVPKERLRVLSLWRPRLHLRPVPYILPGLRRFRLPRSSPHDTDAIQAHDAPVERPAPHRAHGVLPPLHVRARVPHVLEEEHLPARREQRVDERAERAVRCGQRAEREDEHERGDDLRRRVRVGGAVGTTAVFELGRDEPGARAAGARPGAYRLPYQPQLLRAIRQQQEAARRLAEAALARLGADEGVHTLVWLERDVRGDARAVEVLHEVAVAWACP